MANRFLFFNAKFSHSLFKFRYIEVWIIAKAIVLLKEYLDMACFIVVRQHIHKAAQGFSPEERDTLRQLLLRLADNLSETQEDTE